MPQSVHWINECIYRYKCQVLTSETGFKFNLPPNGHLVSDIDYTITGNNSKQVIRYLAKLGSREIWFSAGISDKGFIERAYIECTKKRPILKSGEEGRPHTINEIMLWGTPLEVFNEIRSDAKKRSSLKYWIEQVIEMRKLDDFIKRPIIKQLDVTRLEVYVKTHYPSLVRNTFKPKTKKKQPVTV